ncbi:nitronate monooxygenase [Gordonia zhaorongruii]|uniref:nitronate monooxygenase n=1 Tax=Gordonia zhaorongruii TaxID=2597659 RepID=UPI001047F21D|nr:nitronate monooxygenase [Gordonia zhaorongruii]
MYSFDELQVPIVGAPMAGGTSTPELTAAVSEAGGFGFHGGGYLSGERLREAIAAIRGRTRAPFGVNVFVPEEIHPDAAAFAAYRDRLTPLADRLGVALPETVAFTDDSFGEKIDVLIDERVAVVSFTFGLPERSVIDRLHAADISVSSTVTSVEEARQAADLGVDSLCAQGVSAGGHRATFHIADADPEIDTVALVGAVIDATGLPTVGAGGVGGASDVQAILDAGGIGAQIGTLLLRCPEAGTKRAHRDALADPRFTETVTTRAYSGRLARGLVNDFIRDNTDHAPAAYPQVNTLTGGIRKAAADDPEVINLWAGAGFRSAREAPVSQVVADLVD